MVSRAPSKISSSKGMRWKYTTKYSTRQCALVLLAWVVIAYSNGYLPCLWIISCTILKIKLSIYACTHAFVVSRVCRSFFTGKLCLLDLEYSLLFCSFYRTYSPESSSSSCGLYGSSSRLLLWCPNPIDCKIYLLVLYLKCHAHARFYTEMNYGEYSMKHVSLRLANTYVDAETISY
jgi:hypothetical protein